MQVVLLAYPLLHFRAVHLRSVFESNMPWWQDPEAVIGMTIISKQVAFGRLWVSWFHLKAFDFFDGLRDGCCLEQFDSSGKIGATPLCFVDFNFAEYQCFSNPSSEPKNHECLTKTLARGHHCSAHNGGRVVSRPKMITLWQFSKPLLRPHECPLDQKCGHTWDGVSKLFLTQSSVELLLSRLRRRQLIFICKTLIGRTEY